ncbi:MAG: glycosyltransferase family 2 protein [Gammaproteobacteria bacterium]|nr:glycosyltransferase family 2 protein [Gammaproteobacteria bacterium]MDE2459627.1 glycosyltransferase family 2 protein [Gammaproteobacteria bacterium]
MAATLSRISVVMIVRDAAATLAATLDSVRDFGEALVYDNGSRDETLTIAARYPNVKVHKGEFRGFGPTRNAAATMASNDWIFSLDADEVMDPGLASAIAGLALDKPDVAYTVERQNYFLGKRVRHAGWGSQWLTRLYNRSTHKFTDVAVHEKVELKPGEQAVNLSGVLRHTGMRDAGDFLVKMHRYTMLKAGESTRTYPPVIILFKTVWAFIRAYFLRLGMLDGWRGLLISVSEANGVFYKYIVIYSNRERT